MGTIIPIMKTIQPSLSNALFSKVRQCVLALLYGQPERSFHTSLRGKSAHTPNSLQVAPETNTLNSTSQEKLDIRIFII